MGLDSDACQATSTVLQCFLEAGFVRIEDSMMSEVRAKYSSDPALITQMQLDARAKLLQPLPPTPTELDLVERADNALYKSEALIEDGLKQLIAPALAFLPAEFMVVQKTKKAGTEI